MKQLNNDTRGKSPDIQPVKVVDKKPQLNNSNVNDESYIQALQGSTSIPFFNNASN